MSTSSKAGADAHSSAYHHGNLREALIEAGLKQLESAQNAEISLRELARQVGVSANATYRHFANKEALMAALAAEGFRRLALEQLSAMATRSGAALSFREAGLTYVRFARTHPALFRLMFSRFGSAHKSGEMLSAGQLLFQGAAGALGLKADDPKALYAAIHAWSLVHGLSHLILEGQFDGLIEDIDGLAEAVLHPDVAFGGTALKNT